MEIKQYRKQDMKKICIAVTGAAGQIGYSLLFRLASGEVFGKDTDICLRLLEVPAALRSAEGVAMELDDCAFSNLSSVSCYDDPKAAFCDANWVLMIGASPRKAGMERGDLIRANGPIFKIQGSSLSRAADDVRVVVVGNPCNTNALIAASHAPEVPQYQFSAMTALDEGRAKALLAKKISCPIKDITNMSVWGNHSTTMYPNFELAKIKGQPLAELIDEPQWFKTKFLEKVQKRGAEIIAVRGKSSAASAASACIDHIKNLNTPTPAGEWFSAAVMSPGELYGVPKGLMYSFPLRTLNSGKYEIIDNLTLSDFAKKKLQVSWQELEKEKALISDLLGTG
jgi:malate dehydrogenase